MDMSDDFPMMMEREASHRGPHGDMIMIPDTTPPVAVSFGLSPVLDGAKTKEAGHDVYKDVEFVKIAVPGDKNSLFFQPSNDLYRARFPKAYAAFKAREHKPMEGMPVGEWAPISRSMALTLRAAHIDTVEALAAVHDGNIDRIGSNGRELREKARAWLADAKTGAAAVQLAGEKQALQDQIAAMQAQILELSQRAGPAGEDDPVAAARKPSKAKAA